MILESNDIASREGHWLRFILPSVVGALIFLFPVVVDGQQTIVFGVITTALGAFIGEGLDELLVGLLIGSAILTPLYLLLRDTPLGCNTVVRRWFGVHPVWIGLRVAGGVLAAAVYFGIGPELIRAADTGMTVFHDICIAVLLVYLAGTFLMGLLTDYGLMEFMGTLARRPFRALFRLPGRSAVDALASFVSASGLGLLLTIRQYELGRYTAREACVISCSFSVVSIPFALVIASVAGVPHLFFSWYLTLIVACIAAAMVVARIGPLAGKPETLFDGAVRREPLDEDPPGAPGSSIWARAMQAATLRAKDGMGPFPYLRAAALQCGDLVLGVLGPIMAFATVASIVVFHTALFDIAMWPLAQLLGALGFPEADAAAKGFAVGVLDQFMPALVASGIESEFTRFVLAGLSVTQLVYFSEVAMLLLRSSLPITVGDLLITFLLRTVVVAPIVMLGAWLIV
mgnify:CR=1 FL=1